MSGGTDLYKVRRALQTALIAAICWITWGQSQLAAQPVRQDTSLAFVPADTAFYVSALRTREVVEDFLNSKAFARLKEMPLIQQGIAALNEQLGEDGDLAPVKEFFSQPENEDLKQLLIDAVSHEIFFLGSESIGDLLQLVNQLGNAVNAAQLEAAIQGEDEEQYIRLKMFEFFEKNADKIQVFDLIIGLRISDNDRADRQLSRLEELLRGVLAAEAPELAERLSRESVGNWEGLSLRLDGNLLPWDELEDELNVEELDVDPDRLEKMIDRVKKMTLVLSVGRRDNYLVVSVGDDNSFLGQLGSTPLLADKPELQPVLEAGGKPLTGISYVSGEFLTKSASYEAQVNQIVGMAQGGLSVAPLPEELKDELSADIQKLADKFKQLSPKFGPQVAYEFRIPGGFEAFTHDWTEYKNRDGSKPLGILRSLGNPVAFYAARQKYDPQNYETMVNVCQRVGYYLDRFVELYAEDEQKEQYAQLKQEMAPLLKRLDAANREKLFPAVADGQSAIALDVDLTSRQWHVQMPRSDDSLPLPGIVLFSGLSDSALYKEGWQEYFDVANLALQRLHEQMPDRIPEFQLPKPEKRTSNWGTIYFYQLPPIFGLDHRLTPNVGIADTVAIASLSPVITERLLASVTTPVVPLPEDAQRPLASAWGVEWARLIDAIRPWVAYGFQLAGDDVGEEVRDQVHTVLDVLRCFRYIRGATYWEGEAWVTHTRMGFEDLE